jgi:hypothetical protein
MMMGVFAGMIQALLVVAWLGVGIYMIVLATRFVNAVEWIARSLARQAPDRPVL